MNRDEARTLLKQVASTWPGTPVTHEAVDLWLAACHELSGDQAAVALAHWAATESHPPRPADLNAAHRSLNGAPASPRPELGRAQIHVPPARMAPEIAAAELAKMRALLGEASPYSGRRK